MQRGRGGGAEGARRGRGKGTGREPTWLTDWPPREDSGDCEVRASEKLAVEAVAESVAESVAAALAGASLGRRPMARLAEARALARFAPVSAALRLPWVGAAVEKLSQLPSEPPSPSPSSSTTTDESSSSEKRSLPAPSCTWLGLGPRSRSGSGSGSELGVGVGVWGLEFGVWGLGFEVGVGVGVLSRRLCLPPSGRRLRGRRLLVERAVYPGERRAADPRRCRGEPGWLEAVSTRLGA